MPCASGRVTDTREYGVPVAYITVFHTLNTKRSAGNRSSRLDQHDMLEFESDDSHSTLSLESDVDSENICALTGMHGGLWKIHTCSALLDSFTEGAERRGASFCFMGVCAVHVTVGPCVTVCAACFSFNSLCCILILAAA